MRTAPALLIVLAATLALVGCVPDDDPIVLDPDPSVSPIFESDEEALAAAEAAYAEYLAASDIVTTEGGNEPERLFPFLAEDYRDEAIAGYSLYSERGWRSEGSSAFDSAALQQYSDSGDGIAEVSIYLCLDVTAVRILDTSSKDVTPERDDRIPLEVQFKNSAQYSSELVQTGSEQWPGDDFCG